MSKKIRTTIPEMINEILQKDMEDFEIVPNKFYNLIFYYYNDKKITLIDINTKKGTIIQFLLSKYNEDIYYKVLEEHNIREDAKHMRNILFEYICNPKYIREEIIFKNKFFLLENVIKKREKIEIKFNNEYRKITPFFIKNADRENKNYLFCYCEKNKEYRNYRILKIEDIRQLNEKFQISEEEKEYIKNIEKNFDPFLSYNKFIKVRLTDKGKEQFNRTPTNRPKIIEEKNGVYKMECSIQKAKIYFPQFFKEAEILEPLELVQWFKQMFLEALNNYK